MLNNHLPRLYKYLDIEGAFATLQNKTFKWTKPSDFMAKHKDNMDMTIGQLFPEDTETALEILKNRFVSVLGNNTDKQLTYSDPRLAEIQQAFRNNPRAMDLVQDTLQQDAISDLYDVDYIRKISEQHVNEINSFLQGYRVLCVSSDILSSSLWKNYARCERKQVGHKGVALRIEPSPHPEKDSIFRLFKPVQYHDERPSLFESASEFLTGSLVEEQQSLLSRIIDRIIYSKAPASEYSYESEYRCVWPLLPHEEHLGDLFQKFHTEEITGLYFGRDITPEHQSQLKVLAKRLNPEVTFYQMTQIHDGKLSAKAVL